MNLRSIANTATRTVNPNTPVAVRISGAYTIDPATLKQVPTYTEYTASANVQALDGDELRQINYLNIAGVIRGVYLYGSLSGVIRPDNASTAKLVFTTNEGGIIRAREWNVFKVLESWPNWCKVAAVYVEPA